ncbi:MAG: hypothetical protein APR54_05510 [Candidatus Cloacimonas sp. SDB]|nr:MAG: hypothetical protein APR54_05510 [Candidatus Cloacimonas sp. SDB]
MSEWKEVYLKELITLNYGKSLTESKREFGNVPVYSSAGITGYHNKPLVNGKGIIIGRKGSVGTVYKSEIPFFCIDTAYYSSVDDCKADFKYLFYFLKYLRLDRLNEDSAVPGLNRDMAYSINLSIPTYLPEQKSISAILSSFDDKIENLRQQNKTLEKIAQTIFKHWFVDFEFPNEQGKPYKSSGGKMVDSELGEIPEGWRVGSLGEEFKITMGQSPKGSSYNEIDEGMVFYQGRTDFGLRYPTTRLYTTEPKRIAEAGDVLVSVRAPVGDINIAYEKCCIGRGLSAVKSQNKSYCFYKIMSKKRVFDLFEQEGSVFGSLNKDSFNNIESIIPQKEIIIKFERIVNPIDRKFLNNENNVRFLTKTRDTLLPKLMSGEVRVKL